MSFASNALIRNKEYLALLAPSLPKPCNIKGTVSEISSGSLCKDNNARFKTNLYLINNKEDIVVFLGLTCLIVIILTCVPAVMNREFPSLHKGST